MDEQYKQYYEMINQQQQANNAWSAEQAQKAMDYQTQMSNTAHQREVADLKAAGLNPVLSAGTQGATTSSGHAAQAGNENVTALYGLLSKTIDANIATAEAMNKTARSISSAASSSATGNDVLNSGVVFAEGSWQNAVWSTAQDLLKRKYGIGYETSNLLLNAVNDYTGIFNGKKKFNGNDVAQIAVDFALDSSSQGELLKRWEAKDKERYSAKLAAEKAALEARKQQIRDNNYKIPFYMIENSDQLKKSSLASGVIFEDIADKLKSAISKEKSKTYQSSQKESKSKYRFSYRKI